MKFGMTHTAVSKVPTGFWVLAESETESEVLEILSKEYSTETQVTDEGTMMFLCLSLPQVMFNL